jgi:FkbM family methyltransferase
MLNWLTSLPFDSIAGRAVRFPLRLIPNSHVATIRRGCNRGFRWVVGAGTHGCWLGTYEHDKQEVVTRYVQNGMTVWDIGANAGFYSLAFSRLVGVNGRVFAFEPLATNNHFLLKHLSINSISNVQVVQAAVGAETGFVSFLPDSSVFKGRVVEQGGHYLVAMTTADDFLTWNPSALPAVVKIDVEGAEAAVLEGAMALLRSQPPLFILALHGQDQERRCRTVLDANGYRLTYLDGRPVSEGPLTSDEVLAFPPDWAPAARHSELLA